MAKSKTSQQAKKGKSSSKSSSLKSQPAAAGLRSTSNINRTPASRRGAVNKGKPISTRSAFMRGARRRGGIGTWGLVGLLGILVVVAVLYFTGAFTKEMPAQVSVAEAYKLYPDKAYFLDVREVVEWEAGRVPETTNIPRSELETRLNELPKDQDIVVICRSGNRTRRPATSC